MDTMNEKLREYAKLLIEVGLHVQKGQTLVISSPEIGRASCRERV